MLISRGRYFCNPTNQPKPARSRRILPEFAREEFKKIELLCTEYKGLSMTQELEIFQRVQLGMRLSNAESFRATRGVWQDLAKQYVREFSDVVNCKLRIQRGKAVFPINYTQWSGINVLLSFG